MATPSTQSTLGKGFPSSSYWVPLPKVSYKPNANETTAAMDKIINTLSFIASQQSCIKLFDVLWGSLFMPKWWRLASKSSSLWSSSPFGEVFNNDNNSSTPPKSCKCFKDFGSCKPARSSGEIGESKWLRVWVKDNLPVNLRCREWWVDVCAGGAGGGSILGVFLGDDCKDDVSCSSIESWRL